LDWGEGATEDRDEGPRTKDEGNATTDAAAEYSRPPTTENNPQITQIAADKSRNETAESSERTEADDEAAD
jgi:hypothetical protein